MDLIEHLEALVAEDEASEESPLVLYVLTQYVEDEDDEWVVFTTCDKAKRGAQMMTDEAAKQDRVPAMALQWTEHVVNGVRIWTADPRTGGEFTITTVEADSWFTFDPVKQMAVRVRV